MSTERITDDLDRLLALLPAEVQVALQTESSREQLLEVVLDLGRVPEARYPGRSLPLGERCLLRDDLQATVERLGRFGADNRAGIERTLHRISAIRNRRGDVVGLTCRVGRAVFGTVAMVRDLLDSGQSLLLMGRPGVGKTTALREIARVLADELEKRVVVIDTSNEIAGDGDIPHPAIGRARRMQVARPELQHQVMIEAVENHMPEVIVIDEIGTELEAQAARTIAERGVMLVATAHGNALANLIKNPTLCDLVGGIESVTLGDEEARRRRSQKTVLERAAEPTFPLAVEMHSRHRWAVHADVGRTVDLLLRGQTPRPEERELSSDGSVRRCDPLPDKGTGLAVRLRPPRDLREPPRLAMVPTPDPSHVSDQRQPELVSEPASDAAREAAHKAASTPDVLQVICCGLTPRLVEEASRRHRWPVQLVDDLSAADVVLSVRQGLGRQPDLRRQAREARVPILVIKADTLPQVERALERLLSRRLAPEAPALPDDQADAFAALEECRLAVEQVVVPQGRPVELLPRNEEVRRMQADLIARYRLRSDVFGQADQQRLRVFPP
ncbi:MAG: AAA family ATPase [Synechococcaceae bacterium WB9_4xC_028]|jgi:stage III sporulation protein SpoIIIAA|uniref:AAA family ATPase n=1 Tax=Synechococcus sp. HK01-R TaxID=2751171 RepID=UPI001623B270|nr:AAA family ATPase [Synechococcus sp. HK01-R]NDD45392.1 AAA family ATPase [Synechococcaceae bacterium WB9_4xB_025]NDD68112.1 AAA family ATPase [Synechococcaceae bacterium WB9_4xC_028]QNG28114.1 AAA family ATPase [Synechococcus sp. HK01-R]